MTTHHDEFINTIEEMKSALVREIVERNKNGNMKSIKKEDYQWMADFITNMFHKGGSFYPPTKRLYAKKIMRFYAEELKQYDINTLYVLYEI